MLCWNLVTLSGLECCLLLCCTALYWCDFWVLYLLPSTCQSVLVLLLDASFIITFFYFQRVNPGSVCQICPLSARERHTLCWTFLHSAPCLLVKGLPLCPGLWPRRTSVSCPRPTFARLICWCSKLETAVARIICNGQGATEKKTFLLVFKLGLKDQHVLEIWSSLIIPHRHTSRKRRCNTEGVNGWGRCFTGM